MQENRTHKGIEPEETERLTRPDAETAQTAPDQEDAVFSQENDAFRDFFAHTAAVLPKEMKKAPEQIEMPPDDAEKKKPFFARFRGMFSANTQVENDADDDAIFLGDLDDVEDEAATAQEGDIFFPQSAPEETHNMPAATPKLRGKVRFVVPGEVPAPQEVQVEMPEKPEAPEQSEAQAQVPAEPASGQDPTDALIATILSQGVSLAAPMPAASEPAQDTAAPQVIEMPPEEEDLAFDDLSQETAFLREECAQRTVARDNVLTRLLERVQGWQENRTIAKETAQAAQEEAELTDFIEQMGDGTDWVAHTDTDAPEAQVPDVADVADVADAENAEDALDLPILPSQVPAQVDATVPEELLGFEDIAVAVQSDTPPVVAQPNAFATVQTAFATRAAQKVNVDLSLLYDLDETFAQVEPQTAVDEGVLAQRDVAAELEAPAAALAELETLAADGTAQGEEQIDVPQAEYVPADVQPVAEEITAPKEVEEVTELEKAEEITEIKEAEEITEIEEMDVVEAEMEADIDTNIVLVEDTAAETAIEAQEDAAAETEADADTDTDADAEAALALKLDIDVEAQAAPTVQTHRAYCLFDQETDETAAEAQWGEIGFVGVAQPAALNETLQTDALFAPTLAADTGLEQEIDPLAPLQLEQPAPQEMNLLENTLLEDAQTEEAQAQEPFEQSPHRAAPTAPADALPEDGEGIQFGLSGMRVKLLVRTATTAVCAVALLLFGLMGQGMIGALPAVDPASAPVPFLLVQVLLLVLAMGVSYTVMIDGVFGLWKTPSADTPVAIAAIAALAQLLLCLALVDQYDYTSVTLFSALAGIALFADALGGLVMAQVIQGNFNLYAAGVPHFLAYRVAAKDTLRTLADGVDLDRPALLASRPVQQMEGFLEKSFSPRASDQRAQWISYGLLGAAALACVVALLTNQGLLGVVSNVVAVLCVGVPLSVTLVSALPSLFLHRAAAKVGAMVPGWQSIETLGDVNLLAVDAKELFPPLCAQLYGIKTFQKERIDLAILYATSILMQSCDTLHNLFAGMIEYKQEMLYPVKDLVNRPGLGFIGWCENYRVILGTRALMQAEGVPLPAMDYENRYSKDGKRQVLYLAVSGQLYAMFLVGYRGEKSVAHSLRTLRKEHIRLVVNATDPTLTAARIAAVYYLPEGFVTMLADSQGEALVRATDYRPKADGCVLHLGNFASLVGGVKAAAGAAEAERSASAIQLVWAGFSILLSLFLCLTGGLMQVALVAIVLYQIAWTVLTLGVVLTKRFE